MAWFNHQLIRGSSLGATSSYAESGVYRDPKNEAARKRKLRAEAERRRRAKKKADAGKR